MKRGSRLPKTPKWIDSNPLLRPSLSMIKFEHERELVKEREAKERQRRNKKQCRDCRFWSENHCGLYSLNCLNSFTRDRFLKKEEE